MKITWKVSDGYVNHGPQWLEIDDEDFGDMDDAEKQRYIEECVEEDFRQKVSWHIIKQES